METKKKKQQRINESKRLFFEKVNKINKHLTKATESKREKTQIHKIKDEEGETVQRLLEERRKDL
jgi:hypothetical protein